MEESLFRGQLNSAIAFFNVDQMPQVNGVATYSQNSNTSARGVDFGGSIGFMMIVFLKIQ
jgi:hypothetical protein